MHQHPEHVNDAIEKAIKPFPIAYLINQYPKVSHSFIRREIAELELQGFSVLRIALRGWNSALADAEDIVERECTRYVLQDGIMALLWAVLRMAASRPARFAAALRLALKMGRRAERAWPFHLAYLAEACRIVPWLSHAGARHLHAHFGTNSAEVAMLATALGGPPYSFTIHGAEEFAPDLRIGDKAERAAFVVAVCSFGRSQLYRCMHHAQWRKVQVVHCGLERAFHAVPPVAIPSAPRLVCVGRLCEQKGQLLLLDAVSHLARKGIALELVLAGDGEMRAELEAQIAHYGLQNSVRITGWISSAGVRDEILAARALVLPSFSEGLPVAIMEAMALRRPVLSTYVAGIPELVLPGETGWLFPAGDVDALTNALESFLATPQDTLERMGCRARERVLERHSVALEVGKLARRFRAGAQVDGAIA